MAFKNCEQKENECASKRLNRERSEGADFV